MTPNHFVFNSNDGKTLDKAALISNVLGVNMVAQTISERTVLVEGDIAVVFGTAELRFAATGKRDARQRGFASATDADGRHVLFEEPSGIPLALFEPRAGLGRIERSHRWRHEATQHRNSRLRRRLPCRGSAAGHPVPPDGAALRVNAAINRTGRYAACRRQALAPLAG